MPPSYEFGDEPQQIRIVFEGMDGYVPTALVALTRKSGTLSLGRRLNLGRASE